MDGKKIDHASSMPKAARRAMLISGKLVIKRKEFPEGNRNSL